MHYVAIAKRSEKKVGMRGYRGSRRVQESSVVRRLRLASTRTERSDSTFRTRCKSSSSFSPFSPGPLSHLFSVCRRKQSKKANFDATHELEELLLEDNPLKARKRNPNLDVSQLSSDYRAMEQQSVSIAIYLSPWGRTAKLTRSDSSFLPYDYLRQPRRTWFVDESGTPASASASGHPAHQQQPQQASTSSNQPSSSGMQYPSTSQMPPSPSTGGNHLAVPSNSTAPIGVREGAVRIDQQPLADLTTSTMMTTTTSTSMSLGEGGSRSRSNSALGVNGRRGDGVEMTQVRGEPNTFGASGGVKTLPPTPTLPSTAPLPRPSGEMMMTNAQTGVAH